MLRSDHDSRPALALAVPLLIAAGLAACGTGEDESTREPTAAEREERERQKEARERKAMALLRKGIVAPVKQKLEIFASVIARYPDGYNSISGENSTSARAAAIRLAPRSASPKNETTMAP